MSYALNTATINATATVFTCTGSVKQNIQIANAPVLVTPTFRDLAGVQTTGAQVYLAPGFYSWRKPIDSLSIVWAVSGQSALLSAEGLLLKEANQ